jgi:hypothetical protein
MPHKAHALILPGNIRHDFRCAVAAAIIYDNDLEVVSESWQRGQRVTCHRTNVVFFIERREH